MILIGCHKTGVRDVADYLSRMGNCVFEGICPALERKGDQKACGAGRNAE